MQRRQTIIGAIIGAALIGAGWLMWDVMSIGPTVEGVDVSNHQGAIDWRALAKDNVHFAYIKASEGGDFVDARFHENWKLAHDAGLYVGGYHFFTLCRPGAIQAAHFARTLPRDTHHTLPPAVDLEHMGPCRHGPTMTDVAGEVRVFLDVVERSYGVRPVLYTTRQFHDAHLTTITGERFWIRSLFRKPAFRTKEWVVWQHHNRGTKKGVKGPIDINAFRGDLDDLGAFALSTSSQQGNAR
jgi:lysozyme